MSPVSRGRIAAGLYLTSVLAAACVAPSERVSALPSLQRALRSMRTLESVDPDERALLRRHHGWTDAEFAVLNRLLGESFAPVAGYPTSIGGRHVEYVGPVEGDATERAIASLERNSLLADMLERGEIDRVTGYLRSWPEFDRVLRRSDAR